MPIPGGSRFARRGKWRYDRGMAWDCTLHAVDDASFAKFMARFLRGMHRESTFDRAYDADEMIAEVKSLIAEDPETGARALGELALLYVSTETPHVYGRGVALSLWDDARFGPLPQAWLQPVETRLTDILAAYPKIAGLIPHRFDRPCCVGPFVAARNVPALLAHVEQVLETIDPDERIAYRPLRQILRVAAARRLGYWEGTDIDVTPSHEEWLLVYRESGIEDVPSPLTSPIARPIAIDGTRMLVGEHFVLHELETSTFPPEVTTHDGLQVTAAAYAPWGGAFVRMATDRTARPFKFACYEMPARTPLAVKPPFAVGRARSARDGVLLFPQPTTKEQAPVRPVVLLRDGFVPVPVPAARLTSWDQSDAIAFGDGALLLIWDKVAYRWDGVAPPVAFEGSLDAPEELYSAVTLSDGAIVGGFGRKLIRIDGEGRRTTILPLENVLAVGRGPDDVLIIGEGDNPEGDVLKLWWPRTAEVTSVPRPALGLAEAPMFTYYDPASRCLVVASPGRWTRIPWRELEVMRRVGAETFAARRAAG